MKNAAGTAKSMEIAGMSVIHPRIVRLNSRNRKKKPNRQNVSLENLDQEYAGQLLIAITHIIVAYNARKIAIAAANG